MLKGNEKTKSIYKDGYLKRKVQQVAREKQKEKMRLLGLNLNYLRKIAPQKSNEQLEFDLEQKDTPNERFSTPQNKSDQLELIDVFLNSTPETK